MILQIGSRVMYAGREWEVYGPEVDDQNAIMVVLIEPDYDAQSGEPDPTVYVRDLSGITTIEGAA